MEWWVWVLVVIVVVLILRTKIRASKELQQKKQLKSEDSPDSD